MGGAEAVHLLEETRSMTHRNSPLTPAGRLRLVERVETDGRPIAHVATEAGIARSTLTKWVHRYRGSDRLPETASPKPAIYGLTQERPMSLRSGFPSADSWAAGSGPAGRLWTPTLGTSPQGPSTCASNTRHHPKLPEPRQQFIRPLGHRT